MSALLRSGKFNPKMNRLSDVYIYNNWKDVGFLEGLDRETGSQVAICLEVAVHILLFRYDMWDVSSKLTGELYDYKYDGFDTVIFPIMRRVATKIKNPMQHASEIFLLAEQEMNKEFSLKVIDGDEACCKYFYDKICIEGGYYSKQNWQPKYKNYNELVEGKMKQYKERDIEFRGIPSLLDWEAEYVAYVADIIIDKINNKYGTETGI